MLGIRCEPKVSKTLCIGVALKRRYSALNPEFQQRASNAGNWRQEVPDFEVGLVFVVLRSRSAAPFREFPASDVTGEHAIRLLRRYRYRRGPVV